MNRFMVMPGYVVCTHKRARTHTHVHRHLFRISWVTFLNYTHHSNTNFNDILFPHNRKASSLMKQNIFLLHSKKSLQGNQPPVTCCKWRAPWGEIFCGAVLLLLEPFNLHKRIFYHRRKGANGLGSILPSAGLTTTGRWFNDANVLAVTKIAWFSQFFWNTSLNICKMIGVKIDSNRRLHIDYINDYKSLKDSSHDVKINC